MKDLLNRKRSKTVMYAPYDSEETQGLLAETWNAVIGDDRLCSLALGRQPSFEADREASGRENAAKAWQEVLPAVGNPWYHVRLRYGWTRRECTDIVILLSLAAEELRGLPTMLSGTRVSLLREAERCQALEERWKSLLNETPAGFRADD